MGRRRGKGRRSYYSQVIVSKLQILQVIFTKILQGKPIFVEQIVRGGSIHARVTIIVWKIGRVNIVWGRRELLKNRWDLGRKGDSVGTKMLRTHSISHYPATRRKCHASCSPLLTRKPFLIANLTCRRGRIPIVVPFP